MISEPSARISWWSRPTALCSASSERKLFEQTISARRSVSCAGVAVAAAAHFAQAHAQARLGELPRGLGSGEAAADDLDVEGHGVRSMRAIDATQAIHVPRLALRLRPSRNDRMPCASSPSAMKERRSAEFLAALQNAGVERVIDVRALPLSRRPGFSKTPLSGALEEAGIEYVHLKALGTPADGRAAARAGRHADLERIYAGQLELPEAIAQVARRCWSSRRRSRARLLCFEREPAHCHRSLLLDAVAADAEVVHLFA